MTLGGGVCGVRSSCLLAIDGGDGIFDVCELGDIGALGVAGVPGLGFGVITTLAIGEIGIGAAGIGVEGGDELA